MFIPLSRSILFRTKIVHTRNNISSMDYKRALLKYLRYRYYQYRELQIKHLEIEALIKKISNLRLLLFNPQTSQILLTILAWYQHFTNFSHPVFENDPFTVFHINSLCFKNLVRLLKYTT